MRRILWILAAPLLVSCTTIPTSSDGENCYDAKVGARPIEQIPTSYPKTDDPNRIVFAWPWFVDLEVKRVMVGNVSEREIQALAVLHSAYVYQERTWLLRRNSMGGFNILRGDPKSLLRCAPGVGSAAPYIRPAADQTYADLRRKSEEEYRKFVGAQEDE